MMMMTQNDEQQPTRGDFQTPDCNGGRRGTDNTGVDDITGCNWPRDAVVYFFRHRFTVIPDLQRNSDVAAHTACKTPEVNLLVFGGGCVVNAANRCCSNCGWRQATTNGK